MYKFDDNERTVDFVLLYELNNDELGDLYRNIFLYNLKKDGIEYELSDTGNYYKIFIPKLTLYRYCDALQIKLPIKKGLLDPSISEEIINTRASLITVDSRIFNLEKQEIMYKPTINFLMTRLELFDVEKEDFFLPSLRSIIVNTILNKTSYTGDDDDIGIDNLIKEDGFISAFPLHDALLSDTHNQHSERHQLLKEWGSFKKLFKTQPIQRIHDYFGSILGLYFLWLGFYTFMLIPASILGILSFIYGLATLHTDYISEEICKSLNNYTMCPKCDTYCDFWTLREACTYSKITYLFDNNLTIAFAFFMSIWSTFFLKLWKRYSAEVIHIWGFNMYVEKEVIRNEYILQRKQLGVISFWKHKFPRVAFTFSVALFMVSLILAVVFAIIMYRIILKSLHEINIIFYKDHSNMFVSITAGVMNLIVIFLLEIPYRNLSYRLTELEYQRTRFNFENSLNLKIYIFQFVNYYSSIFYVAFIKGVFIGYPSNYHRIFGYRQEECDPGGCLMELFTQLAIIMIGKQTVKNIITFIWPYIHLNIAKKFNDKTNKYKSKYKLNVTKSKIDEQVEEDSRLKEWQNNPLSREYLTMVIQYGFITIFVVAFPLGPFFALVQNIFEIRIQAQKFLKFYRRPAEESARTIGIWFKIIKTVSALSVLSNAFIIAYSSNFIPKLMYEITVRNGSTYFADFVLSDFNVSDFEYEIVQTARNVNLCKYMSYRKPAWEKDKYTLTDVFWKINFLRLVFVIVYQNIVYTLISFLEWTIQDIPRRIERRIEDEKKIIEEFHISKFKNYENENKNDDILVE